MRGNDLSIGQKHDLHHGPQRMENPELLLLPIACGDGPELTLLARNLSSAGIKVTIAPNQRIDPHSHTAARDQYRADRLLGQARRATAGRVLAITGVDLYMPGLNFVFGSAGGRAAVVSIRRLRSGADAALLEQRLLKEAWHELGHTFGLGHCEDPHCVMSFSNSLADTDRKSSQFCNACQAKLNRR
jgi:archaemetzincin